MGERDKDANLRPGAAKSVADVVAMPAGKGCRLGDAANLAADAANFRGSPSCVSGFCRN
jgi:hypothetical protein